MSDFEEMNAGSKDIKRQRFVEFFGAFPEKALLVDVPSQSMLKLEHGQATGVYPVSTSRNGIGNQQDSYKTPLGMHRIHSKIGEGSPLNAVFVGRVYQGHTVEPSDTDDAESKDVITTRILWLEGLEEGVNKGDGIDSYKRYIYIHGSVHERLIGRPASGGCVRMMNRHVLELFGWADIGTPVLIV